jgi:hypothetical protein
MQPSDFYLLIAPLGAMLFLLIPLVLQYRWRSSPGRCVFVSS